MTAMAANPAPDFDGGLFGRLRAAAGDDWARYVTHPFVLGIGSGHLLEASFRHYLVQDYLFLVHFARAYALAVYKSDDLADMRQAGRAMSAILDMEMKLHVDYCAGWGLSEAEMAAAPEATATMAYTRYVLERGMAGDVLDLHVALLPCIIGYAEIGRRLADDPATTRAGNPYDAWIGMYAGPEYQEVAAAELDLVERLVLKRGGENRFGELARTFRDATRLETAFWDMGWRCSH